MTRHYTQLPSGHAVRSEVAHLPGAEALLASAALERQYHGVSRKRAIQPRRDDRSWRYAVIYLATVAALTLAAAAAFAEEPACNTHANVKGYLAEKWGETPIGAGLAEDASAMMEVYANPSTGTWTMTTTDATGTSCVLGSGIGWAAVKQGAPA